MRRGGTIGAQHAQTILWRLIRGIDRRWFALQDTENRLSAPVTAL